MNEIVAVDNCEIATSRQSQMQDIAKRLLEGLDSVNTKRVYSNALDAFIVWYNSSGQTELNKATIETHKQYLKDSGIADSSINQRLAAIKRFASEAYDNGLLSDSVYHGINNVKSIKRTGNVTGNWLNKDESKDLIKTPDTTTAKGLRDSALLALMLYSGLRREEICSLQVKHLQRRDGKWVLLNFIGKGNKTRTVPINNDCKKVIDKWLDIYEHTDDSYIFCGVHRSGTIIGSQLTGDAILKIIRSYNPDVAAHDLRRTFAKLALKGGTSIEQISQTLGHSSIVVTQRYLGLELDLENTASDSIKLDL